ncbi:hypothetical protein C8R44DRAFT_760458 [Mycena epipterygia]|nr:hypothetical protein C8R44DRAFT_760458 [Mycena epipterygia]
MYWSDRNSMASTSSAGSCTPPTPSSDLPSSPFMKSAWPTPQSDTTNEVLQSVLRVRKTWKTFRGGETVWPLELEAALIEGLERYQPDDSRETRMLGRFPRRNRFISDYIWEKTGKRRSPKQVGSRLQQLRESCGGKKLLHLLSPFREPAYPGSAASADSALSSPVSEDFFSGTAAVRHTVIYIDIVPEGCPDPAGSTTSSPWSDSEEVVRASDHPRRLGAINPTVSFTSPSPIVAYSRFTVYSEELILHAETVPLVPVPDHTSRAVGFLYSTRLVPKYWKVILDSPDPTRFTILQEVVKYESPSLVFSATYKFSYPQNTHKFHAELMNSGSHIPRLGMQANETSTYDELASFADARYENAGWNAALTYSRENPPSQRHHSPGSDTSSGSLCFPPALSNYVS